MNTEDRSPLLNNRGFLYGDAVIEHFNIVGGQLPFWEAHYFRMMASMRILRMAIPMHFTMDFLYDRIMEVFRDEGSSSDPLQGKIAIWPTAELGKKSENDIAIEIAMQPKENFTEWGKSSLNLTLFKDHRVSPGLLSSLRGQSEMIYKLGELFALENGYDTALILNSNNSVIGTNRGALFTVVGDTIYTPPIQEGVYNEVYRNEIIKIIKGLPEYTLVEKSLAVFDITKAEEVFLVDNWEGVGSVSAFRKSTYNVKTAQMVREKLKLALQSPN